MPNQKNILLTGANGQLGYELQRSKPNAYNIFACDVEQLDITELKNVRDYITANNIDLIINAAAYTAVDKAESDKDLAYKVNETGAQHLATVAKETSIPLIHVSTDFVFSGQQGSPYTTEDEATPDSVYGASKLAGEQQIINTMPDNYLIVRTSWLYSAHGNNFVKTMLRLMQEKSQLGIVADQTGTPTWAKTLADTIWALEAKQAQGIYHCSDNGVASWYDFAVAIQQHAMNEGLLHKKIPVKPIQTSDYPTPAKRPAYSVMDKSKTETTLGYSLPHWQESLINMLKELKESRNK
jgi:dTDP-4-dehydrorhamnose reductase